MIYFIIRKKIEKFDLVKKYAATGAAKREAALKLRAGLSDFQRFKVMVLKKRVFFFNFINVEICHC